MRQSLRPICLAMLLCCSVLPGLAQNANVVAASPDMSLFQKKLYISSAGDTLQYRILYPEGYEQGGKYPLFIFLHGSGERGSDNEKQLTHGGALFLADSNRKQFPAIVVFPQCPQNESWTNITVNRQADHNEFIFDYSQPMKRPLQRTLNLILALIATEKVNKKKVFLSGLSLGGMGTFELVYHAPAVFHAAAPICGGGDTASYNRQTAKVPFRIFHGADDQSVNVQYSRDMVKRLENLKAKKVSYIEYPGVKHDSWNNAFAEPDFLAWFWKQ
ncbi:alpha/beta hydrolase-fold protein [Flavihumibacter petaseus]|uniref:Uncharacterized protein n=1 Tax=Flavihumibacter petaseus NBRC 106054 TaxID=1220578 RepID=A0A0E9N4G2_9BACT|nr:alpha/beta hydrolase-fold protein [Flavihumibacter petaseus]GAO44551.1 hypothetical protein FPE01S_03_05890 [Flavihumibacter petaseus NBRC 106054]